MMRSVIVCQITSPEIVVTLQITITLLLFKRTIGDEVAFRCRRVIGGKEIIGNLLFLRRSSEGMIPIARSDGIIICSICP